MKKADPIRCTEDLTNFKNYYLDIKPNPRNYLMIVLGLNTALRISDILNLKWGDVYDVPNRQVKSHLCIKEHKTGKAKKIFINSSISKAIKKNYRKGINESSFLISHNRDFNAKISRIQAYRIIHEAAEYYNLDGVISCHSLRKTFGYQARVQGADASVLVDIYNHSSFEVTKRYLGIAQDDYDNIYMNIRI